MCNYLLACLNCGQLLGDRRDVLAESFRTLSHLHHRKVLHCSRCGAEITVESTSEVVSVQA